MAKILVAVWEPLINRLNHMVKTACLKRDEYLDHVLRHEAQMLKQEVKARNSDDAKAHIAKHLGMLQRRPVNLNLSPKTVQTIADACEQVNVPRDAFINRVILFLVLGKPLFQRLFGEIDWKGAEEKVIEDYYDYFSPILDGALPTIQDMVTTDPFRFYRVCIEITNGDGGEIAALHDAFIRRDFLKGKEAPKSSIGFNCHLLDTDIEGHPAREKFTRDIDELLSGLSASRKTRGGAGT